MKRLLDLFCGAGGAAMGYHWAGFDVVGVDLAEQPYYPFPFLQADALEILKTGPFLGAFDVIHASPPCQFWSEGGRIYRARPDWENPHQDLLTPTLEGLRSLEVPWVVENVQGALACPSFHPILTLHGGLFGLNVVRRRLFESTKLILAPTGPKSVHVVGVYGDRPDGRILNSRYPKIRAPKSLSQAQEAMGMDWADWHGTKEAIPPAYTEFIGTQLLAHLSGTLAPGRL